MESRETIRAAKALILAGGLLIIGIVVGFILAGEWNVHSESVAQNANAASAASTLESPFTRIADRTLPAVVSIETKRNVSQSNPSFEGPYGDFFRRLFPDHPQTEGEDRRQMRVPSSGSGFIFDKQGRILTNNHVVRDAADITVTLSNHKKYKAKVVGTDPSTDVAVIQIQGSGDFPVVPLGDSDEIRIGDWAVAIGNALGELEGTLTVGVVSAKGRSNLSIVGGAPVYQSFIQTDASINFGNSGGPLLNIRGEAIGINTAINPSGTGIGFAIPINMAKSIATQLVSTGKVTRGYLGIVPQELTPELAENWGIEDTRGVLVGSVSGDGPASKAGFQVKDVITTFDGKNVDDVERFRLLVADTPVNKKVRVGIVRSGKPRDLYVTLSERPAEDALQRQARPAATSLGIRVESVTGETAKDLGIEEKEGVLVVDVVDGGPGDDADLRRGDVIKEVNDQPVKDTFEYDEQVRRARERNAQKPIVLLIKRGDSTRFIAVQPGE
ncbi:MAG TPA: Do family serine endopeptidase [Candidatus Eisenbacteria bacterium]|nr:Do family serine endopeptidase [Candidatus Eisenbacteria bacterium]